MYVYWTCCRLVGIRTISCKRTPLQPHPFVLRPGDLHGRNVIVSHAFPRRIRALVDWDFGGPHVLPFAEACFEPSWPDSDDNGDVREEQAEVVCCSQILIDKPAGELPYYAADQMGVLEHP